MHRETINYASQPNPRGSLCSVGHYAVTWSVRRYGGLEISPTGFDFGTVPVAGSKALALTMTNTSRLPITVNIASSDPRFKTSYPSYVIPVADANGFGAVLPVNVLFYPDSLASVSATLTLTTTDSYNPTISIPVSGAGLAPACRDHFCNGAETCSTCPDDCGSCVPVFDCSQCTCGCDVANERCTTCVPIKCNTKLCPFGCDETGACN